MIGVLFWNTCINKRSQKASVSNEKISRIEDTIVDIVNENSCNIIVLAEFDTQTNSLCNKLSTIGKDFHECETIVDNARVKILSDNNLSSELIRDSKYYLIYDFSIYSYHFLISGVHLPSKIHSSDRGIQTVGRQIVEAIKEAEKEVKHEKIVLIGDFNANPFEAIMTDFDYIHAIFDSYTVETNRSRKLYGDINPIFYNPMWNLLGDNNYPKGSYYSDNGDACKLFWHIFDQVVMSADFLKAYKKESLKIIFGTNGRKLMNKKGIPDKENYSDHLPIYFAFEEALL